MKKNIVNYTPHKIVETITGQEFEPCGTVARVEVTMRPAGDVDGIPVIATEYGEVEGLPEPKKGDVFIVSSLVLDRYENPPIVNAGLAAVVAPGDLVRDEDGKPVGCRGFKIKEN